MSSEVKRPVSPLSSRQTERILAHWSAAEDTCHDEPQELELVWPCDPVVCKDAFGNDITVPKTRFLPDNIADEARAYIRVIVSQYPFQLRAEMARPMWHRFLDVYNDTGSRRLALRAI